MADENATGDTPEVKKSRRKLTKDLTTSPGTVVIEVAGGVQGKMSFPFSDLPPKIQEQFGPFGLGHKLGDSAAGRSGADAEEAINKVWNGLKAGEWSVRAPAVPKVKLSDLAANFAKLSKKEQEKASGLLTALGIELPT